MPQFILKINLGNDGMISNMDLGLSLIHIGDKITYEGFAGKNSIRDINGNVVGHYEVV